MCCGSSYIPRRPSLTDICCGGKFYNVLENHQCCGGRWVTMQQTRRFRHYHSQDIVHTIYKNVVVGMWRCLLDTSAVLILHRTEWTLDWVIPAAAPCHTSFQAARYAVLVCNQTDIFLNMATKHQSTLYCNYHSFRCGRYDPVLKF